MPEKLIEKVFFVALFGLLGLLTLWLQYDLIEEMAPRRNSPRVLPLPRYLREPDAANSRKVKIDQEKRQQGEYGNVEDVESNERQLSDNCAGPSQQDHHDRSIDRYGIGDLERADR